MSLTSPARQFFFETPPRAAQLGVPGGVIQLAVTTTAIVVQLNTLFPQLPSTGLSSTVPAQNSSYMSQQNGVCDQFITLEAVTADVGYVTGKVIGDVTTGGSLYNAPALAVVATVSNTGAVTLPAASSGSPGICCGRIPAGTRIRMRVTAYQDLFLGLVGSTTGNVIIYQSSGSDA